MARADKHQWAYEELAGYGNLWSRWARNGEIPEAEVSHQKRSCLTAATIRALWAICRTNRDRLMIRMLCLTRVLLTRPQEMLIMKVGDTGGGTDWEGEPFVRAVAPHIKVDGHRHSVLIWSDRRGDDPDGLLDALTNFRALGQICGAGEIGRTLFPRIPEEERNTVWAPDYVTPMRTALGELLVHIPARLAEGVDWYSARHAAAAFWGMEGAFVETQGNWSTADGKAIPRSYGSPVPARAAAGARAALRELDGEGGGRAGTQLTARLSMAAKAGAGKGQRASAAAVAKAAKAATIGNGRAPRWRGGRRAPGEERPEWPSGGGRRPGKRPRMNDDGEHPLGDGEDERKGGRVRRRTVSGGTSSGDDDVQNYGEEDGGGAPSGTKGSSSSSPSSPDGPKQEDIAERGTRAREGSLPPEAARADRAAEEKGGRVCGTGPHGAARRRVRLPALFER